MTESRAEALSCLAPAKVNLALHVTGMREDGYHEIDTLAAFADTGDRVGVAIARGGGNGSAARLVADGPFAGDLGPQTSNLAVQAAAVLGARLAEMSAGRPAPVVIWLTKNLPVASGIGGGSADAAAVLRLCGALWNLPPDFDYGPVTQTLGADVGMCLASRPLRARGRGERIDLLPGAADLAALLVNPGIAVETGYIFGRLVRRRNGGLGALSLAPEALARLRNDLEPPAIAAYPVIGDLLAALRRLNGCLLARMSGSGATCFGLFADMASARAARAEMARRRPGAWCVAARLGAPDIRPTRPVQGETHAIEQ